VTAKATEKIAMIPYPHPHLTQTINLHSAACGQHSTALFFFGLQADNQQKNMDLLPKTSL
jgi:hypothetical protein